MRFSVLPLLALALASCSTIPRTAESEPKTCPVIDSSNWHAWIEPKRDGQDYVLNISGEVGMPTPAYKVSLTAGPMDRKMPPGQRFTLEIEQTGGMAAQVVTALPVRHRDATPYPKYGSVTIVCEGEAIAVIEDVTVMDRPDSGSRTG